MYRSPMSRVLASAKLRPSMRTLAPPRLLLGQKWTPPVRQPQQLRSLAVLNAVPFLGRRRIDRGLKAELDQARSMEDTEHRRRRFFDVARRVAANNGSDNLEFKSPQGSVSLKEIAAFWGHLPRGEQPETRCHCSVDAVGSHNMRYSLDMAKPSRWRIWVAVDAELRPLPDGESRTVSVREALDAPLTTAIMTITRHVFEEAKKHSAADTPEAIDVEILVWATVIPLVVDTRTWGQSTHWVGKLGERRPWKNSWFIIPIPFFFDF